MECKLHEKGVANSGYGLSYDPLTKKTMSAHRKVFRDTYGFLPPVVMHICDNPLCVNPEHLRAGTQSENIKDCVAKGRHKSHQKLSLEQCNEIKSSELSSRKLGEIYGVHQNTILNIKNNRYNYK